MAAASSVGVAVATVPFAIALAVAIVRIFLRKALPVADASHVRSEDQSAISGNPVETTS